MLPRTPCAAVAEDPRGLGALTDTAVRAGASTGTGEFTLSPVASVVPLNPHRYHIVRTILAHQPTAPSSPNPVQQTEQGSLSAFGRYGN